MGVHLVDFGKLVLYTEAEIIKKAKKIASMYDFRKWRDTFTVTMQEMEIADIRAQVKPDQKHTKRECVLALIVASGKIQGIDVDQDAVGSYIDDMAAASKGKYAINKVTA